MTKIAQKVAVRDKLHVALKNAKEQTHEMWKDGTTAKSIDDVLYEMVCLERYCKDKEAIIKGAYDRLFIIYSNSRCVSAKGLTNMLELYIFWWDTIEPKL